MEERRFPRGLPSLAALFDFIDGFGARQSLSDAVVFELRLAIEELFVNLVKYHPEGTEAILLRLERDGSRVRATLEDYDVERWDVTAPPPVDHDLPLEQRKAGGRGMHLVRQVTDDLRYDYRDRRSTITFTKRVDG
jgi:serine/threonine-protein kinase RsbW